VVLSTVAVAVGEEPETIEEVYEPFLLQLGLLQRTPRGRVVSAQGWRHVGLEPPPGPAGDDGGAGPPPSRSLFD
jgi:Holliday junction DNA helicase RuvB